MFGLMSLVKTTKAGRVICLFHCFFPGGEESENELKVQAVRIASR